MSQGTKIMEVIMVHITTSIMILALFPRSALSNIGATGHMVASKHLICG